MIEIIILISVEYKIKPISFLFLFLFLFLSVMEFCLYSLFFPITVSISSPFNVSPPNQLIENRQQIDCRWHLLLIVVKIHLLSLQALYVFYR
nr:MAG TPA: hypothetical protein [Caudoviricetes sp.]